MTVKYIGSNKSIAPGDTNDFYTAPGNEHTLITCLSSDTKPTEPQWSASYSWLFETDTNKVYFWNGSWTQIPVAPSGDVYDVVSLSQAEYDALSPPVATTLYLITS